MSAYIGASPASRRFQSLKELTGSPTCRQKACWESPLWACSSTQACHCEAGWREWRRFDMGTDAPSVNDGISVGGQAISRNDAPGWPLTSLEPWLDPDLTDRETIRHLVHHLPHDRLTHWPVSTRVNKPVEDDPALIEAER